MPIGGAISNYPQGFTSGLSVRGMPLIQMQPGNVFWLNNSTTPMVPQARAGSDNNHGTYLAPFATLQYAMNSCMAGRGDIIFVGAGHYETISSATALSLNTAGVAIIGLGAGSLRPQFVLDTANTATITVNADNISIQNCLFTGNFLNVAALFTLGTGSYTASIAANVMTVTVVGSGTLYPGSSLTGTGVLPNTVVISQASGTTGGVGTYIVSNSQTFASGTLTQTSKGFALDNCEVRDTSAILNLANVITTSGTSNAHDGLQITRNKIVQTHATAAANLLKMVGTNDSVTIDSNFYSSLTTDAGAMIPVTAAKIMTNFLLTNNRIVMVNAAATATGIWIPSAQAGSTGLIDNNTGFSLSNTTLANTLLVTASTGIRFGQNRYARSADKSSVTTLPALDS